ncbi:putative endopeptidase [Kineococcus xinjiangensis]|uniref:Putative endopeptidase n=1 Tax=Kineococcus xinjiangensis TaxID=512762 RepID=A0A2S6IHU3_9ACTN|nr:M13-type metalloendopeptidase [Kineococcus xinjiangensis]PPK93768.1 putative endopeptidase [Kineococcus xinjiangensis]
MTSGTDLTGSDTSTSGATTPGASAARASGSRTSGIDPSAIDPAVRPQDDLFRHVNGAWLASAEIPADRALDGAFIRLRDESEEQVRAIVEEVSADPSAEGEARAIGDLYASFMDVDAVEALGASPLEQELALAAAVADVDGLVRAWGRLLRQGVNGPFAFYVDTDSKQSDRYLVHVTQYGLSLPDESYYREEQYAEIRAAFRDHVQRMLELAGLPDPAGAAERILALETDVAAHHWDRVKNRDATLTYNLLDRAALEELLPALDWAAWLAAAGIDDAAVAEVVVRQPGFLAGLSGLLTPERVPQWREWLQWRIVHGSAAYLSSAFVDENFAFYGTTLSGVPQLRERWKRGVGLVEGAMGEALGKLYVQRHYPPVAKARMDELVANLVEAYRQDIQALDWMTEETKARALEKLGKFTPKVGHPVKWRDYSGLVVERDDLLGNVRRSNEFDLRHELGKLGGPVDRDEWFMTPQTVNAYYNPGMNEIVFPAAILRPPFFDPDADDAANYGGIGAVIGHEIGHGFDDQGAKYDGDGNLRDWWTDADREEFGKRTAALIAQFDALEPEELPGQRVNGALTVGENIGDLGGLTIAHKAYLLSLDGKEAPVLDGLTGEQRLFFGWAAVWRGKVRPEEAARRLAVDPHSPPEFRCNAVVRNLDEFHDAFGVTEGDGLWMAPEERVRIW